MIIMGIFRFSLVYSDRTILKNTGRLAVCVYRLPFCILKAWGHSMKFGNIIISAWIPVSVLAFISQAGFAEGDAKTLLGGYLRQSVVARKEQIPVVTSRTQQPNQFRPYAVTEPRRTTKEQSFPDYNTMANVTGSWTTAWRDSPSAAELKTRLSQIGTDFSSKGISGEGLNRVADQLLTPGSGRATTGTEQIENGTTVGTDTPAAAQPPLAVADVRPAVILSSTALAKEFKDQGDKQDAEIAKTKTDADKKFDDLADKEKQQEDANRQAGVGSPGGGSPGGGSPSKSDDAKNDKPDDKSMDPKPLNTSGLEKLMGQGGKPYSSEGLPEPKDTETKPPTKDDGNSVVNPVSMSSQANAQAPVANSDPNARLVFGAASTPARNPAAASNLLTNQNSSGGGSGTNSGPVSGKPKEGDATAGDPYSDTGVVKAPRAEPTNFAQSGIYDVGGGDGGSSVASIGKDGDEDGLGATGEAGMSRRPDTAQLAIGDEKAEEPGVFKFRRIACGADLKDMVAVCQNHKLHIQHAVIKDATPVGPLQAGLQPG